MGRWSLLATLFAQNHTIDPELPDTTARSIDRKCLRSPGQSNCCSGLPRESGGRLVLRTLTSCTCDLSLVSCIYTVVKRSHFDIEVPDKLIALARKGDLHAFERLYRLFERPVYTLALRLLNDADAAHDVLHDAMLKVFEHVGQYRSDAPFWGWLRQIALNEALMRLRRSQRLEIDSELPDIIDTAAPPWVHADAGTLERCMNELPDVTRALVWLFHVEGYTHIEIAEFTGKTVSFSKSQVARGTAKLRALLAPVSEPMSCLIAAPVAS